MVSSNIVLIVGIKDRKLQELTEIVEKSGFSRAAFADSKDAQTSIKYGLRYDLMITTNPLSDEFNLSRSKNPETPIIAYEGDQVPKDSIKNILDYLKIK